MKRYVCIISLLLCLCGLCRAQKPFQPDSPRLFEYSNDTICQSVEVSLLDDSRISFRLTTENKIRKKTAVKQGVATNEQKDFGASETDEDETGSLYPVVEYTYEGDCWLAFRFDAKYDRLRIEEADNEKPVPGCPLKSVGVLMIKRQHLKFIPEEFNNIEVGFSKTGMTLCSPGYPNGDIPLNTLLINTPEKIVYTMQSGRTAVMIPICIADNISLRRLHKYHKDDLAFHVKVINEEKVYSGKVYDEEDTGDRIPIPSHLHKEMIEDRDLNNKEAQKYNDDELDEGVSYPNFMNLNVLDYVQIPFQSGLYEIWYTFRGLESNHCCFDIIESSM